MKKVFLSAIMMIAFVGTSMANDIAEKEVVTIDAKEIVIGDSKEVEIADSKEVAKKLDNTGKASLCMYAVANTLSLCTWCDYMSDVAYNNLYQSMVDSCIKATK